MYVLLVAYILAINFYAFLLIKTLKQQENEREVIQQSVPLNAETPKPEKYLGKLITMFTICTTETTGGYGSITQWIIHIAK